MHKSYPNERDCEHGSLRGSCETCDYEEEIQELSKTIELLNKQKENDMKLLESAQEELEVLKNKKFSYFGNEECWHFSDDGYDNLDSLVCPVVMSKEKAVELVDARTERNIVARKLELCESWLRKVDSYLDQSSSGKIEKDSSLHLELKEALSNITKKG